MLVSGAVDLLVELGEAVSPLLTTQDREVVLKQTTRRRATQSEPQRAMLFDSRHAGVLVRDAGEVRGASGGGAVWTTETRLTSAKKRPV